VVGVTQKDVVKYLSTPKAYAGAQEVLVKETHMSYVFLVDDNAYKMKKDVRYPYLDYSSVEKRKLYCEKEFQLLQAYGDDIAISVCPVYALSDGTFSIGKSDDEYSKIADYVILMRRFPEAVVYQHLSDEGELDRFEMMDLAEKMVDLHEKAKVRKDKGSVASFKAVITQNCEVLQSFAPRLFRSHEIDDYYKKAIEELEKYAPLIEERRNNGMVKECHGDLQLRNICMKDKKPVLFDPIEFNDDFSCIDTLYDLSYLLLDLEFRGQRRLCSILFNHYMAYSDDLQGIPLLSLFQSCKSAVRALVNATLSETREDEGEAIYHRQKAYEYFVLAREILNPPAPFIVACGGLSGSGKSRLTREIAPFLGTSPGAMILRTDILRKRLCGELPHGHLHKDSYTPEMNQKTYDKLRDECTNVIKCGRVALADGIFASQEERENIEQIAKDLGVPFYGFWMDAPLEVRAERVMKRERNPSDVKSMKVLMRQLDTDVGEITWNKINTAKDREETLADARAIIGC